MEKQESYKESIIQQKSFEFSVSVVKFYRKHFEVKDSDILRQLLRSATSIGANVSEAGAGSSKKDFVLKMSISSKEAREASYWLRLMKEAGYKYPELDELSKQAMELVKILTKIVKTSRENINSVN